MQENNQLEQGQFKLFKNRNKTEDKHADMTGEIMLDGTLRWFNAYVNKSKAGETWIKGYVGKPKEPRNEQSNGQPQDKFGGITFP